MNKTAYSLGYMSKNSQEESFGDIGESWDGVIAKPKVDSDIEAAKARFYAGNKVIEDKREEYLKSKYGDVYDQWQTLVNSRTGPGKSSNPEVYRKYRDETARLQASNPVYGDIKSDYDSFGRDVSAWKNKFSEASSAGNWTDFMKENVNVPDMGGFQYYTPPPTNASRILKRNFKPSGGMWIKEGPHNAGEPGSLSFFGSAGGTGKEMGGSYPRSINNPYLARHAARTYKGPERKVYSDLAIRWMHDRLASKHPEWKQDAANVKADNLVRRNKIESRRDGGSVADAGNSYLPNVVSR